MTLKDVKNAEVLRLERQHLVRASDGYFVSKPLVSDGHYWPDTKGQYCFRNDTPGVNRDKMYVFQKDVTELFELPDQG